MADGPVLSPPSLLAATTPDPLNMNTPDFTMTPSTAATTAIATPNSLHLPQSSAAKPAKKRKSWGQALPEPKTNLPPRKRAKTADEKEQRRIERIKRNRAAAHNSRERKRQEAERLEVENHALKLQINALHQQLAQKDITLDKCKEILPGGLPQLTQEELASIKVPEESIVSTPSSYDTIDPRASLAPSSINEDFMTPSIKMEPMSPASQMHKAPSAVHRTSISLDQTQHSAAMLCDLQCRSSENNSPSRWKPHGSFMDAMASSYGHDDESTLSPFDNLIDYDDVHPNYTTDATTFGGGDDLFSIPNYGLKDTFLAPELTLASAPNLGDYSATFCDGS
ncbi:hypothetical protein D6D06_05571 [Aureobasidium pullulans]|uniref:BZIP domain-containing protein n=1 Tax=Aureobasidium pullulans TaxID=5580 RepID=A0A4S9G1C2_AURPU|nr:hypothetical protein D6D06_05571 [Aureobasidium pullulans]THX87334.1 hypothetical protein D6D05_02153 [Aureobasidium pullulans]THY35396.1 hypothetical protein D6D01_01350 [Aureobasidium pullulans]THZ09542.1 hypothetical protein D6C95_01201 [Aureobasidium pullulans]TIA23895.1 hypothetical protein D6C80_00361 [Aureobasidium pullulans]